MPATPAIIANCFWPTEIKDVEKKLLNQAFDLIIFEIDLQLELWFYCLAHFPSEYPQAKGKIDELLAGGVCSEGWNFRDNIARAEADGHPNIPLLRELADAISETTLHTPPETRSA